MEQGSLTALPQAGWKERGCGFLMAPPGTEWAERRGKSDDQVQVRLGQNEEETLHVTVGGMLGENEVILNESGQKLGGRDLPVTR